VLSKPVISVVPSEPKIFNKSAKSAGFVPPANLIVTFVSLLTVTAFPFLSTSFTVYVTLFPSITEVLSASITAQTVSSCPYVGFVPSSIVGFVSTGLFLSALLSTIVVVTPVLSIVTFSYIAFATLLFGCL
jgi:hypothetical protein